MTKKQRYFRLKNGVLRIKQRAKHPLPKSHEIVKTKTQLPKNIKRKE